MTSFSLDPTLWCLIGQFWTWVMADCQNPKLTLKINSLRIKRKAQNFASWMLSEYAFKIGRKKGNDFFYHSTTLIKGIRKGSIWKCTWVYLRADHSWLAPPPPRIHYVWWKKLRLLYIMKRDFIIIYFLTIQYVTSV